MKGQMSKTPAYGHGHTPDKTSMSKVAKVAGGKVDSGEHKHQALPTRKLNKLTK